MLQRVSKSDELTKCQTYFESRLHQVLPERRQLMVGHPGMSYEVPIWTDGQLWYTSRLIPELQPNRYWNAFGSFEYGNPSNIILEINISLEDSDRRISGMFARGSHSDDVCLLHRGGVAGGRKGIGKIAFLKWYKQHSSQNIVEVSEGRGHPAEAIQITHLESINLKKDITTFVENVRRFKVWATT